MKKLNFTFEGCAPPNEVEDNDILSLTVKEVEEAILKSIDLVGTQTRPQVSEEDYLLIGQVVSHLCTFIKFELVEKGLY